MKTVEHVKIVEYEDKYAAGVAEMWNESRDNWGGDAVVVTAEDVVEKEAESTNLHLFLAVTEGEVVGYCGLSEYKEDTGSLYIPLLNVHPGYQGLKIGKKLLLQAIEKTVEYKWPRLDLFTWPGNTKAVPLYKKCGFFWEDREDTTHLMNFMPQVLQIDALRPFFERHDWYESSVNPVEIKPDGVKENGFTFYEYCWEADAEFVRIQVERTGRGIRLIETNDWRVEMEVPDFKLLEDHDYTVNYKIDHYANDVLEVSLTGNSSPHVTEDLDEKAVVEKEWSTAASIRVSAPDTEPSPWKTHPVIGADLAINGSVIPLRTGILPQKAGKIDIRTTKKFWRPNQRGTLYLDVESRMGEAVKWKIQWPEQPVISWDAPTVEIEMEEKGRATMPVPVELLKNGFLNEEVEVQGRTKDGRSFSFQTRLAVAFPGFGGKFGGTTDTDWYGYNGPYFVKIEKRNHMVSIGSVRSDEDPLLLLTPKLGYPFSDELSKKMASNVEYIELAEAFVIKTTLESDAFPGLLLNSYYKIYGDGLVDIHHELFNDGTRTFDDLHLLQPVFPKYKALAFPEKDGVLIGSEALIPYTEYLRDKNLAERWLFTKNRTGDSFGMAWPEEAKGKKDDWRFAFEYTLSSLPSGTKRCLGPIQVGVNMTDHWSEWRELVLGETAPLSEKPMFEIVSKQGPVSTVGREVTHSFRSLLTPYVYGDLTVDSSGHTFRKEVKREAGVTAIDVPIVHERPGLVKLSGFFRSEGRAADFNAYQLVQGKQEVTISQKDDCWTVDNGVLSFTACPSYFPSIYSLSHEGKEFLHHQYPEAGPRSWWNPWGGGLRYALDGVSPFSMMKEATEVETVSKVDGEGNDWTGICLSTTFQEHEKMNGVTLKQYALTLPQAPVVAVFAQVDQQAPRTFSAEKITLESFMKPGVNLSDSYARVSTEGLFHTYYAGVEEYELESGPSVIIGAEGEKNLMMMVHPQKKKQTELYMNQDVFFVETIQEWSAASKGTHTIDPTFFFFGEHEEPWKQHPFHRISFKGSSNENH